MDAHYLVCKKLLEDEASIRIRSTWASDARRRIQPQETACKENKGKPVEFIHICLTCMAFDIYLYVF